jgi:hypothetical protein
MDGWEVAKQPKTIDRDCDITVVTIALANKKSSRHSTDHRDEGSDR